MAKTRKINQSESNVNKENQISYQPDKLNEESFIFSLLTNSEIFDVYIPHIESIPIIKTIYVANKGKLKLAKLDKKITLPVYRANLKKLSIENKEKINNLLNIYKKIKFCYKDLKSTVIDKKYFDEISIRYKTLTELILHRGDRNTKYYQSDIKEYKEMKNKPILFVRNLTKFYGRKKIPNIDCLNFDVYPGEFHAFIGANGAGKTTTIKSIIGSYYNWSGTILVNGKQSLTEEAKKKIGYIPEKAVFPENFNTYEYLMWMVRLSGISHENATKIIETKLKDLAMWNMRKRSPNTFSSGQKKKILLLQALIHDPDIIIMDEPVANLDPKARIDFFDQLLELKKQKKGIFISSHVLAELDLYADSLTILDGGKIIYSGNKKDLLNRFKNCDYTIKLNPIDNTRLFKYLRNKRIKYSILDSTENIISLTICENKTLTNLQSYLAKRKIFFNSFNKFEPSLEDIYRKLVIYGSKDTMDENLAANRTEGQTRIEHRAKIY